jgi:hypothetical protein
MPPAARPRRHPTDDGSQLRLLSASPEQEIYELLRPIVLFGQPPAARARETGVPKRTLRRKAARFDANGMRSLFQWNGIRPSAWRPTAPAETTPTTAGNRRSSRWQRSPKRDEAAASLLTRGRPSMRPTGVKEAMTRGAAADSG